MLPLGLHCNAVNASVFDKAPTQAAASQTTRINCKLVEGAAVAQSVSCALACAFALHLVEEDHDNKVFAASPMATNGARPGSMWDRDRVKNEFIVMPQGSTLVLNSTFSKVSKVSVMSVARLLATQELEDCRLSEATRLSSEIDALTFICRTVVSSNVLVADPVWAAFALICFVASYAEGRALLRRSGLTDVDLHAAVAFESYGRTEVTKRAKLEKNRKRSRLARAGEVEPEERSATGRCTTASAAHDPVAGLLFWSDTLVGSHTDVCTSLVTIHKRLAAMAAKNTLKKQVDEKVASCSGLQQIVADNATRCAETIAKKFVGRKTEDTPTAVAWMSGGDVMVGFRRTDGEARATALHVLQLAPEELQPERQAKASVYWSKANAQLAPGSEDRELLPSLHERLQDARARASAPSLGKRAEIVAKRTQSFCFADAERPKLPETGITRTTLCFSVCIELEQSQKLAAEVLAREFDKLIRSDAAQVVASKRASPHEPSIVGFSRDNGSRIEPHAEFSSSFAVGLQAHELLTHAYGDRSRATKPTRAYLGVPLGTKRCVDTVPIAFSEPSPVMPIVDFEFEKNPRSEDGFGLALHVAGDSTVRVPEAVELLQSKLPPAEAAEQGIALLLSGCVQSLSVDDVARQLAASSANSDIQNCKRIRIPDFSMLLLLTVDQAYVTRFCGQHRRFEGAPYAGVYGGPLSCGITHPGLNAHNVVSIDDRLHGQMLLGQDTADQLCQLFASRLYVKDPETKTAAEAPLCTRGMPHSLVPGLHKQLEHLDAATQTLDQALDGGGKPETQSPFCYSVVALPFSPFSQSLRPHTNAGAELVASRVSVHCPGAAALSEAPLPVATRPGRAVVQEPLFARPGVLSLACNPLNSPYEHVATFWNAAAALARLAQMVDRSRCSAEDDPAEESPVAALHRELFVFLNCDEPSELFSNPGHEKLMVTALLLLSVMYPATWDVGEELLPVSLVEVIALASKSTAERAVARAQTARQLFADSEQLAEHFKTLAGGSSASENGAWPAVAALLDHFLTLNGRMDVDNEDCETTRNLLEAAVQNAWRVHSPNGTDPPLAPCPASRAASPDKVRAPHIAPVFCANDEAKTRARGALVGLRPFQAQQLYTLMMGAHLPGVRVQCVRNEGGVLWRPSSAADIQVFNSKTGKLEDRTPKSCSVVQTEADSLAFGSFADKKYGTAHQREAWDANARLVAEACSQVQPRRPADQRVRGDIDELFKRHNHVAMSAWQHSALSESEARALALFDAAMRGADPRARAQARA